MRAIPRRIGRPALAGHATKPLVFAAIWLAFLIFLGAPVSLRANSYDSLLTDSQWYVPSVNLLAYLTSGDNLTETVPTVDQTIWTITDCTDGYFTGISEATLLIGPVTSTSTTAMHGLVTESGQVRINFSSPSSVTIGIGQIRDISGTSYVEMQMITPAGDEAYLTHWAYMAPYTESTTLPPLEPNPAPAETPWDWLAGTNWSLECPDLFEDAASFSITDSHGGYFWGTGGTEDAFTLIGSATPEGNLLFNILLDGTLTSLTGELTGDSLNAVMVMHSYTEPDGFGTSGAALLVPEPSSLVLSGVALLATAVWFSRRKHRLAAR